jgi:hypothetical protein
MNPGVGQVAVGSGGMEISETIAVLGAGERTGFAMARNMARAGLSVRAWNQPAERPDR